MRINCRNLLLTLLFLTVIFVSGCSSVPKPIGEIAGAKARIEAAETNEAGKFAPVEFDRAKTKLRDAQKAIEEEKNLKARRLANEAESDAKLATMKASSTRAKRATEEMRQTVEGMKSEIERIQTR